jgi:glycosyltransferase involved in cell wall biosynthesis
MPEADVIPESARDQIETLGAADIVLGIPSYNNANTIGHVVRMGQRGLERYFPSCRSVIVNSDGGSQDGTPAAVLDATNEDDSAVVHVPYPVYPVQKLSTPYDGIPGKGSAFRTIFLLARKLGARACAVVDSDLRSITPEWIHLLLKPVIEDEFDFVAPYYQRHKYDGTITNSIVYPLTRALYGRIIRQPIGGDFAFSARLVDHYLSQDVWNSDVARFGVDIWVTTQAICGRYQVCQAFLGAKVHDPKDPSSDLSAMLAQVLGSLFSEMERNVSVWQKVRGSEPVPVFGPRFRVTTEPVEVNVSRMIDSFRLGCDTLQEIWSLMLPPATILELRRFARLPEDEFRFSDETWVRSVYDFALGHRLRVIGRDHLLRALTPLYLGWVASFIQQTKEAGPDEVEQRLEKLCLTYEAQKPYLISRWRWPDRFSP